jgi:hypothetical protein
MAANSTTATAPVANSMAANPTAVLEPAPQGGFLESLLSGGRRAKSRRSKNRKSMKKGKAKKSRKMRR